MLRIAGRSFAEPSTVEQETTNLSHRYLWGQAVDQLFADEQVSDPEVDGEVLWALTDRQGSVRVPRILYTVARDWSPKRKQGNFGPRLLALRAAIQVLQKNWHATRPTPQVYLSPDIIASARPGSLSRRVKVGTVRKLFPLGQQSIPSSTTRQSAPWRRSR